ncbi:MAG: aldo/keto reductase [Deltaproteobacteria bacterium]|nr:aldo/keto reductase [Deltaproteobacteria bacterium]
MRPDRRSDPAAVSRRRFIQYLAMLGVGGRTFWGSGDARAAIVAARDAASLASWPAMTYRKLGRTDFNASRLLMGCGASLLLRGKDDLLHTAFEAGINVFDVGYRGYYQYAERNLAAFLKKRRDDIFLISKAVAEIDAEPDDVVSVQQAKQAARIWSERLDQSLADLEVDKVDAYYLMASHNPSLIKSEEIRRAFETAKAAGKVRHLGVSTHRNAQKVLLTAAETGWYDLAMIAITPGGWYDWENKSVLEGSKALTGLQPVLEKAKASGIALVGMKAARHLSGLPVLGWWKKLDAFDEYYNEKLMAAPLSPFQRSYAYVLAHGLDVVNADIQDLAQLRENVSATATSPTYFA